MNRRVAQFTVRVELDPVPGAFNTPGSAQTHIERMLNDSIPHYHPTVDLDFVIEPTEARDLLGEYDRKLLGEKD